MIFDGCVLFSDVDGTLSTYKRTVPQVNIDAINYFMQNGGRFALATGRAVFSTKRILKNVPINCPCIIYNGGEIYDFEREESIHQVLLPESAKQHIKTVEEKFPDAGIEIHVNRQLCCIKYSERSRSHILLENDQFELYKLSELSPDGWHKILFTGTEEIINGINDYFTSLPQYDDHYFLRSEPGLFEVLPIDASKGKTLNKFSELFSVPIKNIFAIGDYYNDIELIKAAGYSAVTADSPEELKGIANYVTCSAEEGAVADFIKHIERLIREEKSSHGQF